MDTKTTYEVSEEIEKQCVLLIDNKLRGLGWIREVDALENIGFVMCYERKRTNKPGFHFAEVRKVPQSFRAYIPHDVILTVFYPDFTMLSPNAQLVCLYHELLHIGWNYDDGCIKLEDHNIKDFHIILKTFGIDWNSLSNEDIPNILEKGVLPRDDE